MSIPCSSITQATVTDQTWQPHRKIIKEKYPAEERSRELLFQSDAEQAITIGEEFLDAIRD